MSVRVVWRDALAAEAVNGTETPSHKTVRLPSNTCMGGRGKLGILLRALAGSGGKQAETAAAFRHFCLRGDPQGS